MSEEAPTGGGHGKPTLADLAKIVGVSKATVSYALNGRPGVSDHTRKRIREAAESIGYSGRLRARAEPQGHASIGAVLSPTQSDGRPNYYVTELLLGAERACRDAGYTLSVSTEGSLPSNPPAILESAGVSGLLYLGGSFNLKAIGASTIPTVLVGAASPTWSCDSVLPDNRRGAFLATTHLIDVGRRRIAFMNGPETTTTSRSKMSGFVEALTHGGVDPSKCPTVSGDFSMQQGYELAVQLFADVKQRPDALFVADDPMALGALQALADLGIDVPAEVAVVGFGNSGAGRESRPSLSTVGVFQEDLGRIGANLLLDRIGGEHGPQQRILVCPRLVIRGSSDPSAATRVTAGGQSAAARK